MTDSELTLANVMSEIKKLRSDITEVGDTVDKDLNDLKGIFHGIMDGLDKINNKLSADHLLFIKIYQKLFNKEPDMEAIIDEAKETKTLYI